MTLFVLKELIDRKNPNLFFLQGEKGKGLRYNITVFDWGGVDSVIREVEQVRGHSMEIILLSGKATSLTL